MIGGVFIVLVAVWMYQAAIKGEVKNPVLWIALGCVTFFVVQLLMIRLNVTLIEMFTTADNDPEFAGESFVGTKSRSAQNYSGGVFGVFLFALVELLPPFMGVVAAGLIRTIFVLKQKLTLGNLFGGIKEMFVNIGNSFKTSQ